MDIIGSLKVSVKRIAFAAGHARWKRSHDYLATLCRLYLEGYHNACSDPIRNGEYWLIRNLAATAKSDRFIVFDVGANIGDFAFSVTQIAKHSVVHCFEPMAELATTLKNASITITE